MSRPSKAIDHLRTRAEQTRPHNNWAFEILEYIEALERGSPHRCEPDDEDDDDFPPPPPEGVMLNVNHHGWMTLDNEE